MISSYREAFNASFTPERYQALLAAIDQRTGTHVKYRQSETPCFFHQSTLDQMATAGRDLIQQLLTNPRYLAAARAIIPPQFYVPNEAAVPLFVQADFGLALNHAGKLIPQLVEIQGFPSLYAYQPLFARQYIETYNLDPRLRTFIANIDEAAYWRLLSKAITNGHDPENVVLLEIDPENQKTLPDFKATQSEIGIPYVCITKIVQQGNRLFYPRDGKLVPIHRIYNRVIVDELQRLDITPPFSWNDDLNVEWAGHPNWFFRLSKFSIPFFKHDSVPSTAFLHDVQQLPEDLDNYVLKPLFSFAGLGVIVGPTREQIDAIPAAERHQYILQKRVNFEPIIHTPHGPTKAEVRVMYIWDGDFIPCATIIRMGRGKMMGVDHNKNMEWVGGSAGLIVPEKP